MKLFWYRHQVGFADTMAYGSHHFLTNLKLQCLAREALLFLRQSDGKDVWRDQLVGIELLTQQGYARNLRPVGLGDWLTVFLTAEDIGYGSFRLCFRVVAEDGSPVTGGYQTIVCIRDRQVTRTPSFISEHLTALTEEERGPGKSFRDDVSSGHASALERVFWPALRTIGATIAAGTHGLDRPFVTVAAPTDVVAAAPSAEFVFVCAGQTRPDPGWIQTLAGHDEQSDALLDAADSRCGPPGTHRFRDWLATPDRARSPHDLFLMEQLSLYLVAVMTGRALERAGVVPTVVLGHSLGEIAALALAGVVCDIDGLTIVARRAQALLALPGPPSGMVVLPHHSAAIDRVLADTPQLTMAVHNHAQQFVLSATDPVLRHLQTTTDLTPRRLASRFGFHSPLLLDAVAPFAQSLAEIPFSAPTRSLFSPMERAFASPRWSWPSLLASHFVRPLHFADAIHGLTRSTDEHQGAGSAPRAYRFVECNRRAPLAGVLRELVGPSRVVATRSLLPIASPPAVIDPPSPPAINSAVIAPMAIVGRGCVLPDAPDVPSYARLLETDRSAISDASCPALVEALRDFYDPQRPTPDKTYALLSGLVHSLAPLPAALVPQLGGPITKVVHMAALALLECGLSPTSEERVHVVIGSTADGCGEYDEAVALHRLAMTTGNESVRTACASLHLPPQPDPEALEPHAMFGRLARALFGPNTRVSIVDAACASSLYAIDIAARLLASNEADVVLAGGAFAPGASNNCLFAQFGGLSSTGSRPLDAKADGVVFGEGAAFVTLRPLPAAMAGRAPILGVLRGWGYSSDGRSASASAPKTAGQRLALSRAYASSGLDPVHTQYIEAHGTGTSVGDAVEFETLGAFFGPHLDTPLPIGSVKSQIGHTGWAAGVASLIKVLHFLETKTLPAQSGFTGSNPAFQPHESRLTVPSRSAPWPPNRGNQPRRAAINGFGFGGTNGHIIVEAFDERYHRPLAESVADAPHRGPNPTAVCVWRASSTLPADEPPRLAPGLTVLPEVLASMDPTQRLAIRLAASCIAALGPDVELDRKTTAVFVSVQGRTKVIVEANDRLYQDHFVRVLSERGVVSANDVRAAVQHHIRNIDPSGPYTLTGGMPNIASGRVCQLLGFNGPNFVLDPAAGGGVTPQFCARSSIADGSCSMALSIEIGREVNDPNQLIGSADLWCEEGLAQRIGPVPASPKTVAPLEPNTAAPFAELTGGFDRESAITMYVPRLEAAPLPTISRPTAGPPLTVVTVDSESYRQLRPPSEANGWRIVQILPSDPATLESAIEAPGHAIVLVVDLKGRSPRGLVDDATRTRAILGPLLQIAKARYRSIATGELPVGVISLGAWVDDGVPHPDTGLLGGFLKSLGRELPRATIAAVHTDETFELSIDRLRMAWAHTPRSSPFAEHFVRNGQVLCQVLGPTTHPVGHAGPSLIDRDSVIVATGGGRGITVELVAAAIERFGCRAILLGRTDPRHAPDGWRDLDEAAIAQIEPDFHSQQVGAGASLRDSKRMFHRLQAAHEVQTNLARLQTHGHVHYAPCDVTHHDEVTAAIDDIIARYGRIDLVLHSAGVQTSSRLNHKSDADFWRTVDTKIAGLGHILHALKRHPTSQGAHIHLSTSAFSYLGNDGQAGYGAANEAMNRLADCFSAERGHKDAWSAMAWLAWDGIGMTRGSEYRTLASTRRLRGIQAAEGGALWVDLIAKPPTAGSHILLTDHEIDRYAPRLADATDKNAPAPFARWTSGHRVMRSDVFDPKTQPFLLDHRVDGRPVLPACLLIDGIVTHAEDVFSPHHEGSGLVVCAIEACELLRFIPVNPGAPCTMSYRYEVMGHHDDDLHVQVHVLGNVVHSSGTVLETARCYATCRLTLARSLPLAPSDPARRPPPRTIYTADPFTAPGSAVALGGDFDCVRELTVNASGNGARYRPAPNLHATLRGRTLPALLLDTLLRVGIIGPTSRDPTQASSAVYVPVSFTRLQRYALPSPTGYDHATIACGPSVRDSMHVACPSVAAVVEGRTVLHLSEYAGRRRVARTSPVHPPSETTPTLAMKGSSV